MNEKIVLNKHQYAKDNEQKAIEYQKNYANKTRRFSDQDIVTGDFVQNDVEISHTTIRLLM